MTISALNMPVALMEYALPAIKNRVIKTRTRPEVAA
jgi:hypothetical protein